MNPKKELLWGLWVEPQKHPNMNFAVALLAPLKTGIRRFINLLVLCFGACLGPD